MEAPESLGNGRHIDAENVTVDLEETEAGWVRVRVEESWFPLKRDFLKRHSDYFQALFRSKMKESQAEELYLRGGVHARGFLIALTVCREENPTIRDPDELVEAVECAAFLQIPPLIQYLCDIIDTDNCLLLYHAASIFGVHRLFQSAALFLCDAFDDLKEEAESAIPKELLEYAQMLSPASYIALGTHTPSMELLQDSFRVACFLEEKEREWRHLSNLPTACSTSLAGVAVLDNRLYIVGGIYGYRKDTVDSSFCYDPDSGIWTTLPGPQQPRYDFTLLGHEGQLYAIAGEAQSTLISSAERYNAAKGEWTFIKHAPRPVASPASAIARRRIFVCFWKPPDTTDIYEYMPLKDEWNLTTTMIRPQSYGHCMVAHRDNLYVMRNGPCDDFLRCLMDCYNVTNGQWTAMPGHYINSKGALFTAVIRGDSVFTVKHMLTLEYTITVDGWKPRRQMKGFPKSGSLWTCLLRLPKTGPVTPKPDVDEGQREIALPDMSERFADILQQM
ncbi:PREDICTED: kelch repeat and BTB domain-containing protein 13-like [Cyprinodon variegatus]|uniref:Kelch repeat and BTB domain containing 13 n=1 Tax=Cyprinodon variegatus TaxID=28743 RepID=A0A3Q2DET3_CYPVA|nr:PREDICTED: kelch repeat and BTB domain-containing protein 13-like [Cyprinodon variegatus]